MFKIGMNGGIPDLGGLGSNLFGGADMEFAIQTTTASETLRCLLRERR